MPNFFETVAHSGVIPPPYGAVVSSGLDLLSGIGNLSEHNDVNNQDASGNYYVADNSNPPQMYLRDSNHVKTGYMVDSTGNTMAPDGSYTIGNGTECIIYAGYAYGSAKTYNGKGNYMKGTLEEGKKLSEGFSLSFGESIKPTIKSGFSWAFMLIILGFLGFGAYKLAK